MQNLKLYSKEVDTLLVWTDPDDDGEMLGQDIVDLCKKIKPKLLTLRAKFSSLTPESIFHALRNAKKITKNVSDAVKVRN